MYRQTKYDDNHDDNDETFETLKYCNHSNQR